MATAVGVEVVRRVTVAECRGGWPGGRDTGAQDRPGDEAHVSAARGSVLVQPQGRESLAAGGITRRAAEKA